jgi:hypothetical protein
MRSGTRSVVAVAVTLIAVLALLSSANAQPELASPLGSGQVTWSALDKVDQLKDRLGQAGFTLTEGNFTYVDLVQLCCQGKVPDTLANNPWPNAYMAVEFAPRPGIPSPVDWLWQLDEKEAVVFVGQTPPGVRYFSYQTAVNILGGSKERVGAMVGDTINIGTIRTLGAEKTNQPIIYIVTGSRATEKAVRLAVRKAGYPDAIVNVETISPIIAPLGVGPNGSWFYTAHRAAVPNPDAKQMLEEYVKHPPYAVFRLTPDHALTAQLGNEPEPPPVLRVRGTGHTEMAHYPALKRLREAILARYGSGQPYRELDSKVWELDNVGGREMKVEKPYVALQRNIQVIGATRDTNYLANYPNFVLRSNVDEFVIVYGVNHQKTGKATYSSFSIYADKDRWFGLKNGTALSPDFEGSAEQYLPGDPDAQYLYAYKVARDCKGEPYCMEVKVNSDPATPFSDINGNAYACPGFDLDTAQMFFLWRSYMEPATNVGPDDNELLYDKAIYFGPYDFPVQ